MPFSGSTLLSVLLYTQYDLNTDIINEIKQPKEYDFQSIKVEIDNQSVLSHDQFNTTFVTNINDYFGNNFSFIKR